MKDNKKLWLRHGLLLIGAPGLGLLCMTGVLDNVQWLENLCLAAAAVCAFLLVVSSIRVIISINSSKSEKSKNVKTDEKERK